MQTSWKANCCRSEALQHLQPYQLSMMSIRLGECLPKKTDHSTSSIYSRLMPCIMSEDDICNFLLASNLYISKVVKCLAAFTLGSCHMPC